MAASGKDEQSTAQLKRLQAEIRQLNANVDKEVSHKHRLDAKLEEAEKEIAGLNQELALLATRRKKLDKEKAMLDKQVEASRSEAQTAESELSSVLRTAFILGRQPRVKLALEGENPAQATRLLVYYGYYSRARIRRINELAAEINHYHKLQNNLSATEKNIVQTGDSQRQSLAALEKNHTERQSVIAELNRDIAGKHKRIAALKRDAKRLENVVRSVNRDLAEAPSRQLEKVDFHKLRGQLPWPVAGKIVNRFGSQRADSGEMQWEAVRIAAPAGTPVHAIAYGRVAYAGWLPFYGLVLMVDHGNGYLTVYGHNEALYKQVGQRVKPGNVIATVGQSGGQPRPLLYFQIRHHDRTLDPAHWCRKGRPPSN
ncbi:MAG: murein hydrolase activator EnvC family protein [Gammaproteobacteria bacterium]